MLWGCPHLPLPDRRAVQRPGALRTGRGTSRTGRAFLPRRRRRATRHNCNCSDSDNTNDSRRCLTSQISPATWSMSLKSWETSTIPPLNPRIAAANPSGGGAAAENRDGQADTHERQAS